MDAILDFFSTLVNRKGEKYSGKRETEMEVTYFYQGIARRAFRLSLRLADYIEIPGALDHEPHACVFHARSSAKNPVNAA